jgi:hypothetical protein
MISPWLHIELKPSISPILTGFQPGISFSWGSVLLDINLPSILMLVWLSTILINRLRIKQPYDTRHPRLHLADTIFNSIFENKKIPTGKIMFAILIVAFLIIINISYRINKLDTNCNSLTTENLNLKYNLTLNANKSNNLQKALINAYDINSNLENENKRLLAASTNEVNNLKEKVSKLTEQLESKRDIEEKHDIQEPDYSDLQAVTDTFTAWNNLTWAKHKKNLKRKAFKTKTGKLSDLLTEYNSDSNNAKYKINPAELTCESNITTIYFKKNKPKLIVTNCRQNGLYNYPLTFKQNNKKTFLLFNLSRFNFMYESGIIDSVTDMNNDGNLELWLTGTVYECSEDDNPCNSEGKIVVEEENNIVIFRASDHR